MRFNGFLTHNSRGNFCAGVYPNMFGRGPAGAGSDYRATAIGPGVTPIVTWEGPAPGHYAPGGFTHQENGLPNYNTLPTPPSRSGVGYSASEDATFAAEERAVAGAGDSCAASAAK